MKWWLNESIIKPGQDESGCWWRWGGWRDGDEEDEEDGGDVIVMMSDHADDDNKW